MSLISHAASCQEFKDLGKEKEEGYIERSKKVVGWR